MIDPSTGQSSLPKSLVLSVLLLSTVGALGRSAARFRASSYAEIWFLQRVSSPPPAPLALPLCRPFPPPLDRRHRVCQARLVAPDRGEASLCFLGGPLDDV